MRAFPRGVRDGGHRATAADAPVAALETRTRQKFFGQLVHLGETDGAGEGEASVTQSLTGSVQKQTARGLSRGHPPALLGWCSVGGKGTVHTASQQRDEGAVRVY